MMQNYPLNIVPDSNDTLLVTFPDIPEASLVVETADADFTEDAVVVLQTCVEIYAEQKRPFPKASEKSFEEQKTVAFDPDEFLRLNPQ